MKYLAVLAAALLLQACADGTEKAKETLKSRLAEKRYVDFQNLETFPGDVVCGEFRTTDPMRGSNRFGRFIVWGEMAEDKPTPEDWAIFCSRDPGAALQATFGIGPLEDAGNQLRQIMQDLHALDASLQLYLADNYSLPTSEQGLAALVKAANAPPIPFNFRAGGYLAAVPADPWGRPYLYERIGLGGGVAQEYRVYTLGADGVPGGSGQDADVGSEHLKYLDHLAR